MLDMCLRDTPRTAPRWPVIPLICFIFYVLSCNYPSPWRQNLPTWQYPSVLLFPWFKRIESHTYTNKDPLLTAGILPACVCVAADNVPLVYLSPANTPRFPSPRGNSCASIYTVYPWHRHNTHTRTHTCGISHAVATLYTCRYINKYTQWMLKYECRHTRLHNAHTHTRASTCWETKKQERGVNIEYSWNKLPDGRAVSFLCMPA